MKSINFDEGYKEYKINGDDNRVIRIRIADPNMLSRFNTASNKMDELQKKYADANPEDMANIDAELRTLLNDVFQTDICTPAFGEASLMTITSTGKPLYQAFFEVFIPEFKADIEAAGARISAPSVSKKVQKYLDTPATVPDISKLSDEQKAALLAELSK